MKNNRAIFLILGVIMLINSLIIKAQHQNLFLLKKEYKKAPVSAKVESTTKQQSEVYRCIPILSRFYSIYQS